MKKAEILLLLGTLVLLAFLWTPDKFLAEEGRNSLRVRGATTVTSLIQPWVPEFEAQYPSIQVVMYGSTHGEGLKALIDGNADVAMTARELSADERKAAERSGLNLEEKRLCYDAVAIIVNNANPVGELSLDELRNVFGGSYTNWNQLGGSDEPIVVVTLPSDSGMASFLSKDILRVPFSPKAIEARTPREVLPQVRSRKGSISFCRTDLALAESDAGRTKILAIKKDDKSAAIPLSKDTVAKGIFPIIRPLGFCYDPAKLQAGGKEFVEWCVKKYDQAAH